MKFMLNMNILDVPNFNACYNVKWVLYVCIVTGGGIWSLVDH